MRKTLWKLFKETGDIKYYLMLSKLEKKWEDGNSKCNRDCNEWDKL